MQSIIADYARTKAEYLLLATIVAASPAGMTEADMEHSMRLVLEEYRRLPE